MPKLSSPTSPPHLAQPSNAKVVIISSAPVRSRLTDTEILTITIMAITEKQEYSAADTFSKLGIKYEQAFKGAESQLRSLKWAIKELPPKSTVVDVGCGTGKPACAMLANADHDVLGIDITPEMIDIARRQIDNARFEVIDSRKWAPEADASLDGVVSYFAFLAGVTQADIKHFFARAYGWLKPGGIFIFGTVTAGDTESTAIQWMGAEAVVSCLTDEDTIQAIKDVGFVVEREERDLFMPQAEQAGICKQDEVWEEPHLCVCARKPR